MIEDRWKHLMASDDPDDPLTTTELAEGWHWCAEFDGLLVGPGMGELRFCKCLPKDHPAFATLPEDPYDTPEYQAFVEEMAKHCHCLPVGLRPCDGLLAGGLCDRISLAVDEREDVPSEYEDDEPEIP